MRVITAPETPPDFMLKSNDIHLFLGGSIEMGSACNWQDKVIKRCEKFDDNLVLLNPRRTDWPDKESELRKQIDWELYCQDNAEILIYYFAKDTVSPISLLEVGLFGKRNSVLVYIDKEYTRRVNLELSLDYISATPWFNNEEEFLYEVEEEIRFYI